MKLKINAIILIFYHLNIVQVYCNFDFYTSIAGLEELIETEAFLVENFENYVKKVQKTNENIKNFLDDVEQTLEEIKLDPAGYYSNPLNAFKVIRRCVIDWQRLENIVFSNLESEAHAYQISQMTVLGYVNATFDDLVGASKALARLQSTYALEAQDVAAGILLDYEYEDSTFSPHDSFVLGRTLYDQQEFAFATEWLLEARLHLNEELNENGGTDADDRMSYDFPYLAEAEILEYLAPSLFNIGNNKLARVINDELLKLQPTNEHAISNKPLFDAHVREERRTTLPMEQQTKTIKDETHVQMLYEAVCRGELKQTARQQRNLRCRYATRDVPFCRLAPFKMEELSFDPFVAFYHDAVYENEMQKIIEITEDKVQRSKVGDRGESMYSDIRVSKQTWLYLHENKFLEPMRQRLIDITGLNLHYAEPLQVANYGIGGHYGPHFDFSEVPDYAFPGQGNRILTALSYINEVELGGGTAFPFLKMLVPAIKGGLLVWFNMHESLELDYRTLHAGCPVLKGSKWICNEWFHQMGQEFNRPCCLELMGNKSLEFRNMLE